MTGIPQQFDLRPVLVWHGKWMLRPVDTAWTYWWPGALGPWGGEKLFGSSMVIGKTYGKTIYTEHPGYSAWYIFWIILIHQLFNVDLAMFLFPVRQGDLSSIIAYDCIVWWHPVKHCHARRQRTEWTWWLDKVGDWQCGLIYDTSNDMAHQNS